ncbi:zinc-dependent metalloprotease [Roseateles paludis]|jgi:hypothetical protein|uniref:Zinc-dependent metalloprotease n=1 Tax=Roseateles paludis TaxID=3145238 RepID=A0ABV0G669_9BURK
MFQPLPTRRLMALALTLTLGACATAQTTITPIPPANGASAPVAAPRPPVDPTAPKPFLDVIKGAREQPGLFPIWRKDEKVWLEIPKAAFNKPFLFSVNVANSLGERGLYASQMDDSHLVEWRRIGNQVQLVALNTAFRAEGDTKAMVEQSFSPSLITAGVVAAQDHPDRKSTLVDAGMFLYDIPGFSTELEVKFRLVYGPDRANSYFEATRAESQLTTLTARMHYATARIPAPPLVPPAVPIPSAPQTTPDARSFFFSFVYNFRALPETPAKVRHLDPRLGHFMTSYVDLSDDVKPGTRVHLLNRWRLEKKDPAAELSEPVQPIVYWLDKNIPKKYREAVTAGILEWNKAFEKIGFKNAIEARQQPDDADWDNMDAMHASVRWFTGADVGFAIGPRRVDPRTGEILDADIGMSDVFGRGARRFVRDDVSALRVMEAASSEQRLERVTRAWRGEAELCTYAAEAASELGFALDLLAAREGLDYDGPEAEAFAQAVVKDTVMHEIGHTLGLKHNFRASNSVSAQKLKDKAYTDVHGITNSVMDYTAYNIPLKGEAPTTLVNSTLGAYDYWAIEYAYKPLPQDQETAELARIAARSTEPELAYGDDVDQGIGGAYDGFDPRSNQFDLGDDTLAFAKKRLKLSQELWERLQTRKPEAGEDPMRSRRSLDSSFRQLARGVQAVSKYVGGLYAERVVPGITPKTPFRPVEPAQQREALKFITGSLFSPEAFRFKPEFLASQTLDYNEWGRGLPLSIPDVVLQLQGLALDRLLAPQTAHRLIEQPTYVPEAQRKGLISLGEVWGSLQGAIWSELKTGGEIDPLRRRLQRDHIRRLQQLLNRSLNGAAGFADAFAVARFHAVQLVASLKAAGARPGLSLETRAHIAESADLLDAMLKASVTKS